MAGSFRSLVPYSRTEILRQRDDRAWKENSIINRDGYASWIQQLVSCSRWIISFLFRCYSDWVLHSQLSAISNNKTTPAGGGREFTFYIVLMCTSKYVTSMELNLMFWQVCINKRNIVFEKACQMILKCLHISLVDISSHNIYLLNHSYLVWRRPFRGRARSAIVLLARKQVVWGGWTKSPEKASSQLLKLTVWWKKAIWVSNKFIRITKVSKNMKLFLG